jgi:UDP-N-acetylglucosamine 2-epimerase
MIGKNGKIMTKKPESNSILLIDSSVDVSTIKSFIKKNSSIEIISFDFESHKNLKNENIIHEISDTFLNNYEREELQKISFKCSRWYEDFSLKEILEFDGINLAKLSYMKFFIFLIPFLKYFYELNKIIEKYPNSKYYASDFIYKIILKSNLKSNVVLFETKYDKFQFSSDSVHFQTNLLNIKLSNKSYKKLKKFSENILNRFSGINNKLSLNSKFLVEFDTILYKNLFFGLQEEKINSVYFGIRRPSIWNSESYSVIKQSKCQVAIESKIITSNIEKDIKIDVEQIKIKWKKLFENNNFFQLFFNYKEITFWPSLKPFFEEFYYSKLYDTIKTIHIAKEYLKKYNPSHVLVLSESGTTEQIIIALAKKNKIPIILIQHGVLSYDSKESKIINEFTGSMPVISDKFFVWGEAMKKYAIDFGISSEKISVVGSCAHDTLFNNSINENNQDYILFSPEAPSNNHINEYTISIQQEYEDILKKVCNIATKLNKKLIIKLHPHIEELNETEIAKSINPDIQVIKHGNISSLMKSCSLFIMSGVTSAMLDAGYLKKPMIRIKAREWWGNIDTLRTNPAVPVSINNLENMINQIFSDSIFYQNVIKNGNNFVDDCLSNQGVASKNISQLLMNK